MVCKLCRMPKKAVGLDQQEGSWMTHLFCDWTEAQVPRTDWSVSAPRASHPSTDTSPYLASVRRITQPISSAIYLMWQNKEILRHNKSNELFLCLTLCAHLGDVEVPPKTKTVWSAWRSSQKKFSSTKETEWTVSAESDGISGQYSIYASHRPFCFSFLCRNETGLTRGDEIDSQWGGCPDCALSFQGRLNQRNSRQPTDFTSHQKPREARPCAASSTEICSNEKSIFANGSTFKKARPKVLHTCFWQGIWRACTFLCVLYDKLLFHWHLPHRFDIRM